MRKAYILLLAGTLIMITSCNTKKKHTGHETQDETSLADSLYNQLLDEHTVGMKDWMKIETRKKQITRLRDSLAALPAKAGAEMEELKKKLNEAVAGLQSAYDEMDVWMNSMNLDSAKNDIRQRIKYLTEEKLRAKEVNEAIVRSLQRADSLLKAKF